MKRKLLSLLLAAALCLGLVLPARAAEALTPETQQEILLEVSDFIRENCLTSSLEDDPLGRVFPAWQKEGALLQALQNDAGLYERLMRKMLSGYDSHTLYSPAGTYTLSFPKSDAGYAGIGVTIAQQGKQAAVADVSLAGSAFEAGILAGDLLLRVNGESLMGIPLSGISARLRGEAGTQVELTVLRGEQELTFSLTRRQLETPNYTGRTLEDHIYYMKWDRFSDEDGSYARFRQDLSALAAEDCLILDLRDDPGGDLDLACSMVSDLLPERATFFSFSQRVAGESQPTVKYYTSDGKGKALRQICILVNGASASASEVLTASLRDSGYATVVGETTYGKARAQYHVVLPDDSAAVVTAMALLSLRDGDYEGVGLAPDVPVTQTALSGSAGYVPEAVALAPGSCSDNGAALNRALVSLGYLSALPEKPYRLGEETLEALARLKAVCGLDDPAPGAGLPTLRLVNLLLSRQKQGTYLRDDPLLTAMELCCQALAQPALSPAA